MIYFKLEKNRFPYEILNNQKMLSKIWSKNRKYVKTLNKKKCLYSNNPKISKIMTMMPNFEIIINKNEFAKITRKHHNKVIPYTWTVRNGKIINRNYFQNTDISQFNLWFLKPENGSQGRGISVNKSIDHLVRSTKNKRGTFILQPAIRNIKLIEGRKFDIRAWTVFVWKNGVLNTFIYKDSILRICVGRYDSSRSDNQIHLTNYSVQKKCKSFKRSKNVKRGTSLPNYSQIHTRMKRILSNLKQIFEDSFQCQKYVKPGYWLVGFDFIVDNSGKVWLIEGNRNPGVSYSKNQTSLYFNALKDLSTQIIEPLLENKDILHDNGGWELIF